MAERYAAIQPFIERHPEALHPTTARIIRGAETLSAARTPSGGSTGSPNCGGRPSPVWSGLDLLVVPTVPRTYTLAELAADPIGPNSNLGTYTNFVNLLDLCALSVPGPFPADGLPAGSTMIAPAGRDALLAAIGAPLHAGAGLRLGTTDRAVPAALAAAPAEADGAIELVVVGAHLSGMPLNRELTSLGGRFLRAVATAPDYRLYALPGGPPTRPGLVRVEAQTGAAIATEVWALPPEAFGRFTAAIPAPLGIGTVLLADGSAPKGFLCETAGLTGAADISTHGGWRDYVGASAA